MNQVPEGMPVALQANFNLIIEVSVALAIAFGFLISALATLRERHRDAAAWHVWLGALIYGTVFGCLIGFVVMPLRLVLTDGSLPPEQAGYAGLGLFAAVIVLRRGVLSRLPVLGPQVKAYRRAALRRSIEQAEKRIEKLSPPQAAD
jgi:hypothetical protein